MKVHFGLDHLSPISNAVVTSGTFDGVHLGHRKILSRLTELAQKHKGHSVLITFWPHPRMVLKPEDKTLKLLSTIDEKIELLREFGLDYLIVIPFTKEFSQLSSEQFVQNILVNKVGTHKLVIGYDHHFGKNREGSFEYLKEHASIFGFAVEEISRQDIENVGISSTKIREALNSHDVASAHAFLGRHYSIQGKVIEGDALGRTIGFPTANIEIKEDYKLIPEDGVYAVSVSFYGSKFHGMLNIGNRPTIEGSERKIEVHIFNFNQDIYGETLVISFLEFIRNEQKFSDIEGLKRQLEQDKSKIIALLENNKNYDQ
jgi:riboflavin kinase/FMN adenylyltransferase